ncbi:akirin-like [Danaus plexippus]|uniref:Akirin protein n=1 Tax=Danaus plexippus plexippus TaxID=278856 RepID=A0A212EVV2_DANPL|nr:akirin-like [Danaus plexippus]OWR45628.1 akirin protein [Danaus plexippus plexippus]
MACATLKRNLDSTMSMAQMPAKRRRCAQFAASSSTSPGIKMSQTSGSSVFGETVSASAKYTPERMAQELCDEIMRLRRRRQLRLASGAAASCSSSSGSEGDCSPPRAHSTKKVHHRALFTFKQVRAICERMLREQEAALRAEYTSVLHTKLDEQYASFVRFNIDQVQRRPPANTCMPLGMDAEHHMHQDLVPSYLS